jgi:CheY-like chemotaxis protein
VVAKTVAAAMEGLKSLPDWVILDLMLPDGDGEAVLAHIRQNELPIRVAVTSGISDPERLRAIQKLEPEACFGKPVDLKQLLDVMTL